MTTQELTAHLKHLNEHPHELGQDKQELLELENALYDLAEYLEEARLGMISYADGVEKVEYTIFEDES